MKSPTSLFLFLCLVCAALFTFSAPAGLRAEEGDAEGEAAAQEAEDPIPALATDEEAKEALKAFKEAFRARGLSGEEKLSEQDFAMETLSKVQHQDVVDQLFKLTRNRNVELRTAAVLYLGNQRALPGYAGAKVVKAMERNEKDNIFIMSGLESIGVLEYRDCVEMLVKLMRHKDYAIQKHAMLTISDLGDLRFLDEVFKLLKDVKQSQGDSWDGVEVKYDTGTAGDHDQKMAEKIGREKMAANNRRGRRAARAQRDLRPLIEEVLLELTGEEFEKASDFTDWREANKEDIEARIKALEETAAAHREEAKG